MNYIKWFLRIVGSFHLVVGLLGSLSDNLYIKTMAVAWQADLHLTPQYAFTTKLMSAYVIGFALMVLVISSNPIKYKNLLLVSMLIVILEFLQSAFRYNQVNTEFLINPVNTTINLAISLFLIVNFGLIYYKLRNQNA